MRKLSTYVVSATPFDDQEQLDETSLRQHLRRLKDAGVDGVYMGAPGAGEILSMTPDERDRMLTIAVEELKGKIAVRSMGWEPRVIGEMVDFVRRTEPIKPDAVMLFSIDMGHNVMPTVKEMERYYSTVIESTSLPIVLSLSYMVGYFPPLDLIERLLDRFPSIIGIAHGGPNIGYLTELIHRVRDRVEVHCAGPSNILTTLYLGGNGWEGNEGNFAPELYVSLLSAFRAGDEKRVREFFTKVMALNGLTGCYGGPSSMRAMKPLMNAFGFPGGGTLRSPRLPISSEELDKLVTAVLRLELPGIPATLRRRQRPS